MEKANKLSRRDFIKLSAAGTAAALSTAAMLPAPDLTRTEKEKKSTQLTGIESSTFVGATNLTLIYGVDSTLGDVVQVILSTNRNIVKNSSGNLTMTEQGVALNSVNNNLDATQILPSNVNEVPHREQSTNIDHQYVAEVTIVPECFIDTFNNKADFDQQLIIAEKFMINKFGSTTVQGRLELDFISELDKPSGKRATLYIGELNVNNFWLQSIPLNPNSINTVVSDLQDRTGFLDIAVTERIKAGTVNINYRSDVESAFLEDTTIDMNIALKGIWTVNMAGNVVDRYGKNLKNTDGTGFGFDIKTGVLTRTYYSELLQEMLTEPITSSQVSVEYVKGDGYTDNIDLPACKWDGEKCNKEYTDAKAKDGTVIKEELHSIYEVMKKLENDFKENPNIDRTDSTARLKKTLPIYNSNNKAYFTFNNKDIEVYLDVAKYSSWSDIFVYKATDGSTSIEIPTPFYVATSFGYDGKYGFIIWESIDGTFNQLAIDKSRISNFEFNWNQKNPGNVRANPFTIPQGW